MSWSAAGRWYWRTSATTRASCGNPVVDEIGVRSYLGAPLIDRTGIALGTVCVVDLEPRPWGRAGLETIKTMAAELVEQLGQREAGAGF